MSVPLENLYHYIDRTTKDTYGDNVVIYHFYPHGSKLFNNLTHPIKYDLTWRQWRTSPQAFCNDQEPLNFDLYEHLTPEQLPSNPGISKLKQYNIVLPRNNFWTKTFTMWDSVLLLHSEQRSSQVEKYRQCNFIPVYYWSHAMISRDWYRYAEHVQQEKNIKKIFLLYARGWTGTREYRLKFLQLIADNDLARCSKLAIQPVDPDTDTHYQNHKFINDHWMPTISLEDHFATADIASELSAVFELADYEQTDIEVVLETLFDDDRLHFTEKILRPIALGQPFLLVGSHGGLEYLKRYGFKTFSDVWCEDYDIIQDPQQRLQAVVNVMNDIKQWSADQRAVFMQKANDIAEYNKKRFFSQDFFQQVDNELRNNLKQAFKSLLETNTGQIWHDITQKINADPNLQKEYYQLYSQQDVEYISDLVNKIRSCNQKLSQKSIAQDKIIDASQDSK